MSDSDVKINPDIYFYIFIFLCALFFGGTPDLTDAISDSLKEPSCEEIKAERDS